MSDVQVFDFRRAPASPIVPTTPTSWANVAQDYWQGVTNLNDVLITQPAATYFFDAAGDGLAHVGVYAGDLLIVDRSVPHHLGHLIVVSTADALEIGQYVIHQGKPALRTQHGGVEPLTRHTRIWGVVIHSIRHHTGAGRAGAT